MWRKPHLGLDWDFENNDRCVNWDSGSTGPLLNVDRIKKYDSRLDRKIGVRSSSLRKRVQKPSSYNRDESFQCQRLIEPQRLHEKFMESLILAQD